MIVALKIIKDLQKAEIKKLDKAWEEMKALEKEYKTCSIMKVNEAGKNVANKEDELRRYRARIEITQRAIYLIKQEMKKYE